MNDSAQMTRETSPAGSGDGSSYTATDFMQEVGAADKEQGEISGDSNLPTETPPVQDTPQDDIQPVPGAVKPIVPQQQKTQRNFEGLEPHEIALFKQMSNEAYEYIYPKLKEAKASDAAIQDLKTKLAQAEDRRWYEEEGSWNLHPETKKYQSNLEQLQQETSYWKSQLAALKANKPARWLEVDPRTQELVQGKEIEPTPENEVEILDKINLGHSYTREIQGKLAELSSKFSGQHKNVEEQLKQVDKDLFGKLDLKLPHLKQPYENTLNAFPEHLRGKTVYQMLAKANSLIENLARKIGELQAKGNVKAANQQTAVNNGPGRQPVSGNGESTADLDRKFQQMTGVSW